MIEAVFLDFDGVIVESVDIKTRSFAKLFEDLPKEKIKQIVDYHLLNGGVSRFDKFRYIYKEILKRKLSKKEFHFLCKRFSEIVIDSVVGASYVKGAYSFLRSNYRRIKFVVISATPQNEIEDIIRRRRITGFFRLIYGSPLKKNDAIRRAVNLERINVSNAVYIWDAFSDYDAARSTKVKFIARIYKDNAQIFKGIRCLKVKDLTGIGNIIKETWHENYYCF